MKTFWVKTTETYVYERVRRVEADIKDDIQSNEMILQGDCIKSRNVARNIVLESIHEDPVP